MSTMFTNSQNIGISDPYRLLCNLWDKIDIRRIDKYVPSSISASVIHVAIQKQWI